VKSSVTSSKQSSKTVSKPGKEIRLNRYLADCGLGSRRKTEELIKSGIISINGETCQDLARKVDPERDKVYHAGKLLSANEDKIFIILNKPAGYVVTQKDEYKRRTVYDLLPENFSTLPYAGRLDKGSEGLLLFTNDGALIKNLTHPSHKVEKVYKVDVEPRLSRAALQNLRQGVEIEGGRTQSAAVFVKNETEKGMSLKIIITEGRKRQIRQMIEAVGAKVTMLKRLQFGPLYLGNLPIGRWRPLTPQEVRSLYKAANANKKTKQG